MGVRHINPEGLHRNPAFSQAVVVEQPAKTIYVGGQNGVDADGKVVGSTVGEQASQALRNLATILESEGASLADIVSWSIAVVDGHALGEGFAAFQQAWNPADPRTGYRGMSFGEHRARVTADALVRAIGLSECFEAASIDPAAPARNGDSPALPGLGL